MHRCKHGLKNCGTGRYPHSASSNVIDHIFRFVIFRNLTDSGQMPIGVHFESRNRHICAKQRYGAPFTITFALTILSLARCHCHYRGDHCASSHSFCALAWKIIEIFSEFFK